MGYGKRRAMSNGTPPIGYIPPLSAQQHDVFEAVELVRWPALGLRLDVGEGLTAGSNPVVIATRVGRFF